MEKPQYSLEAAQLMAVSVSVTALSGNADWPPVGMPLVDLAAMTADVTPEILQLMKVRID